MADLKDQITGLARRARELDDGMDAAHSNATGVETMTVDAMTDAYLAMTFEERQDMFRSLLTEQGMDGLQVAKKIMIRAGKKYRG